MSSASSQSTSTTNTSSSPISIKNSLIDNKEKLNDLNDQILNSQQLHQQQSSHHHHHHHRHQPQRHESTSTRRHDSCSSRDYQSNFNPSHHKSESIMSSDSDIRFTRKKLGDNQRCGCIVITGFLVALLIAGLVLYAACKYNSFFTPFLFIFNFHLRHFYFLFPFASHYLFNYNNFHSLEITCVVRQKQTFVWKNVCE